MTDTIPERVRRYVLDGSDADLRRLLGISQLSAQRVRHALGTTGIQPGWRVIDCGCGPLGALAVMAEMVGPAGRVVGVDFSEPTVSRARSVAAMLALDNVEVHVGDVHDMDAEALGGPFDLAFVRCFLMHQPDPARTLARIATLIRPGGWIVAHEPLRDPPPRSSPAIGALAAYWEVLYESAERLGAPHGSVDHLARRAVDAGLEVVEENGFFDVMPSEMGFDLHAATIAAARHRAVDVGAATDQEIDVIENALRIAIGEGYDWVSYPFFLALTLRTPEARIQASGVEPGVDAAVR